MADLIQLMPKANKVFLENFPNETCFERAIFFSWYCGIHDCKFCFMSTQGAKQDANHSSKSKVILETNSEETIDGNPARRTVESLLAEVLICRKLGWDIGFLSGGLDAYTKEDFLNVLKLIHIVNQDKIWINIGPVDKSLLKLYLPYIKGVVGSIECVNEKVHDFVCPSKPIQPYLDMWNAANKLNLKCAITIILGLGEAMEDYPKLKQMIKDYNISKIHFYALNPQKDTIFEDKSTPDKEYQAEWIARTRIDFPKIDIQCGIWLDKIDRISFLLNAGANSISKFPALKYFGKKKAKELEHQTELAGRKFNGSITKLPDNLNWDQEVDELDLADDLKSKMKVKLHLYLKKMK